MATVREYRDADRDRLRDLACDNYCHTHPGVAPDASDPPGFAAYFEHLVGLPGRSDGHLFVAEAGDRLVGLVCLLGPLAPTDSDGSGPPYAFMSDLFVDDSYRHRGVGSLLVAHVEAQARELGISRVALRVMAAEPAARRFYARANYAEEFVIMSKDLG